MKTQSQTSARQLRLQAQKRQRRNQIILGVSALLIVALIITVALIGRGASDEGAPAAVVVSDHGTPPNAEPNGRAWGPTDAPIQVIEYADYECESCGAFANTYGADFVAAFAASGKVRFEIRNAPFHGDGARNAAEAAYCAIEQDAFWPMHDSLFLNQPVTEGTGMEAFSDARLSAMAAQLELDRPAFDQCLSSDRYVQQVDADYNATVAAGVNRTPTFVINGQPYAAVLSVDDFRQIFVEIAPEVEFDS